ncbi:tRNA U34 carboxymethyltransferase [Desulfosarcina widdelii]|uniref:tRNA U34 carboxymethyltransferase n=1 Tax=Desulfosarcina widdelii TaxID=947919 RepID=A0A5K7Z543_9BACT|nr:tRNA 5-methoxyuridine(34)/uridine 5-oxyacetic acid(34) synthase CmoB [Desulfosarcina widdelii]BBO76128.1 tRNA U34 carboxymethyltransferase [Desulfosarcina widdelii]
MRVYRLRSLAEVVQFLLVDLHAMSHLEDLGNDPVIGTFLPELIRLVDRKTAEISQQNKKGRELEGALEDLPRAEPSSVDANRDRIRIGAAGDLDKSSKEALFNALCRLKPWRKGPFDVFGVALDSEWNSAIKWNRLAEHLGPQRGKRILDIGASNGYYMFRMAARKPALIIGIEPHLNYYFQFLALSRYLTFTSLYNLPLKLEELPALNGCFDTVLCMGILYHRRSPLDTLLQIRERMVPGGQLVLETLVLEGENEMALFPEKRYAKMKNVFFIPTVACLGHWLRRTGFQDVRCVDISKTTIEEQRKTAWIDTQSLEDFLDPEDPAKTVEGYPAPMRAMVLANAADS